jgi:hypothetical protein
MKRTIIGTVVFMVACPAFGETISGQPNIPSQVPPPAVQTAARSANATSSGLPDGAIRVVSVNIPDNAGFGQPMTAATTLIPAGWQAQGGVSWQANNAGCGKNTPHFEWQAVSPDGISAVTILPEESWSGNNLAFAGGQQVCPNLWIQSVKEYITTWAQYNRPNARILDYRERPDEVAQLNQQLQQLQAQGIAVQGVETRNWAEAGQVLLAYEYQGVEVRELLGIGVTFYLTRMAGVMPGEIREFLIINAMPGYAMRAPAGQLDIKVAEMLRKSARPNPQWLALMAQHNAKMSQINIKGARDRSRIITQTGEEIRQIQNESWRNQNASQDRMQRETIESIRGVETYNDPYHGGTVELDNSYKHAWQLNDGSYVLSDDPSFEPYTATGQDGKILEVAP